MDACVSLCHCVIIILFALDYIHTMYYNTKNLKVVNVRYSPQHTLTILDLDIKIFIFIDYTMFAPYTFRYRAPVSCPADCSKAHIQWADTRAWDHTGILISGRIERERKRNLGRSRRYIYHSTRPARSRVESPQTCHHTLYYVAPNELIQSMRASRNSLFWMSMYMQLWEQTDTGA